MGLVILFVFLLVMCPALAGIVSAIVMWIED